MIVEIDGLHCRVIETDSINTKSHYGFIYVTINKLNGTLYLGKKAFRLKNGIVNAWRVYLGSGKVIKEEINRYGKEYFTRYILALARTSYELKQLEEEYIKRFNANDSDQWLNVRIGTALTKEESGLSKPIASYKNERLIKVFKSLAECERYYNIGRYSINKSIANNRVHNDTGLMFKYIS